MVNRGDAEPLYRQLAKELRGQIVSGSLAVGEALPSEAQMVDQYGVSRGTVRQAVGLLRTEKLVYTSAGVGIFVADPKTVPLIHRPGIFHSREELGQGEDMDGFTAELASLGLTNGQTITVERLGAPEDIADRLGLTEGDPVILRRRIQSHGGRLSRVDSWFPATIAVGTELAEETDVVRGTDKAMEELGYVRTRRIEEVSARMPTPEEIKELAIAEGVPLLVAVGTKATAEHRPTEVLIRTMPADAHVLVYTVDRSA